MALLCKFDRMKPGREGGDDDQRGNRAGLEHGTVGCGDGEKGSLIS